MTNSESRASDGAGFLYSWVSSASKSFSRISRIFSALRGWTPLSSIIRLALADAVYAMESADSCECAPTRKRVTDAPNTAPRIMNNIVAIIASFLLMGGQATLTGGLT